MLPGALYLLMVGCSAVSRASSTTLRVGGSGQTVEEMRAGSVFKSQLAELEHVPLVGRLDSAATGSYTDVQLLDYVGKSGWGKLREAHCFLDCVAKGSCFLSGGGPRCERPRVLPSHGGQVPRRGCFAKRSGRLTPWRCASRNIMACREQPPC